MLKTDEKTAQEILSNEFTSLSNEYFSGAVLQHGNGQGVPRESFRTPRASKQWDIVFKDY
jgi:hypothetical protein